MEDILPHNSWREILINELRKPYMASLQKALEKAEKRNIKIFPKRKHIFEALNLTPLEKVRVVILGQDPYHGQGQAHGLSFSVQRGVPLPPSLKNIFQELSSDFEIPTPQGGDLTAWARQGVLLLNTILTVEENKPAAHRQWGWENLTDRLLQEVNDGPNAVVFVLWGGFARKKIPLITDPRHLILEAPHPSPLSSYRGFFGSSPFKKINSFLTERGEKPIDWRL